MNSKPWRNEIQWRENERRVELLKKGIILCAVVTDTVMKSRKLARWTWHSSLDQGLGESSNQKETNRGGAWFLPLGLGGSLGVEHLTFKLSSEVQPRMA